MLRKCAWKSCGGAIREDTGTCIMCGRTTNEKAEIVKERVKSRVDRRDALPEGKGFCSPDFHGQGRIKKGQKRYIANAYGGNTEKQIERGKLRARKDRQDKKLEALWQEEQVSI